MKEKPSSVSPLGPGEDEYLSWVKELERQRIDGGKEQPSDGAQTCRSCGKPRCLCFSDESGRAKGLGCVAGECGKEEKRG